jgi:hypothetical protein
MYERHTYLPISKNSIVAIFIKSPLRKNNYVIQHKVKVRDSQEQVFMTKPHKGSYCCCIGDHADIHNDNDDDSDDKYADIVYGNFLV